MNICILNTGHVSKSLGGTESVTLILTKEFEKRGHNVSIVSAGKPIDNIHIEPNQFFLPENSICSTKNIKFITQFLERNKVEILINQSYNNELLKLIILTNKNIPIISCIHTNPQIQTKSLIDYWDSCKMRNKWRLKIFFPFYRLAFVYFKYKSQKKTKENLSFVYNHSNAVILLSEKYTTIVRNIIGKEATNKLYSIPNPILNPVKDSNYIKEKLVIFVGRLEFQKRVDRLLNIWKNTDAEQIGWKLVIIGDGSSRPLFEQISKDYKLNNVEFVGTANPEEYYKKASILCITSSHEGLPMVLLEALQYNVIPIAFNSFESLTDIIKDHENGFTIEPFAIDKYSQILNLLMKDNAYRDTIRKNIQKPHYLTIHNIEAITDLWEDLFNKLVYK